jgi:hypothetical protein
VNDGGLTGVLQFIARCVKSIAHKAGRGIVKDAARHECKNGPHAEPSYAGNKHVRS